MKRQPKTDGVSCAVKVQGERFPSRLHNIFLERLESPASEHLQRSKRELCDAGWRIEAVQLLILVPGFP
jgi:hypothetical protein